jgi:uncharacterized protein (DUF885 family)
VRAARFVLDTAPHARQWTRPHSVDDFNDNAAKTEIDRDLD